MTETAISIPVAAAEHWTPSRRMQAAAAAERERVERELRRLSERENTLARELDAIRTARSALQDELSVLLRLSRDRAKSDAAFAKGEQRRLRVVADSLPTAEAGRDVVLRGAQIRETAVRVLASTDQADQAVHYRTWFDLLRYEGFLPAGKDPLATFLTQIGRSPVVQRSTAAGVYSLDLGVLERMRARLAQLEGSLQELNQVSVGTDVDEIARIRRTRDRLVTEVASTKRTLAEALRSLGAPPQMSHVLDS
jgi:hypothetical protein